MLHTMSNAVLQQYCVNKLHTELESSVKKLHIIPRYDRASIISKSEKSDKRFNWKRPTLQNLDKVNAELYVFPGVAYTKHYAKIYGHLGYDVNVEDVKDNDVAEAVALHMPKQMPCVDTIILGYVEQLILNSNNTWYNLDKDISWCVETINRKKVMFVGVKFSYWGDIMYHLVAQLSKYTKQIIYVGKLGSLCGIDVPNTTIATGNDSYINGNYVTWSNAFSNVDYAVHATHYTIPSTLDETCDWFYSVRLDYFRWVDPEIGWAALAAQHADIDFSYIHLVTDNLAKEYEANLTNERENPIVAKRKQYIRIIRSVVRSVVGEMSSLEPDILMAQQKRVDRDIIKPLTRDWKACLNFAYHTQEEAWEIVRELPRREWKEQSVIPEQVLTEIADTYIQLTTTLAYAGYSYEDLRAAVLKKLSIKRNDWK